MIGRKEKKKGNDKSVFRRRVFRLDLKQEIDMECLTESGRQFWFTGQTDAVRSSCPTLNREDPRIQIPYTQSRFVNTSSKHNAASTSHKYKAGSQFWTQLLSIAVEEVGLGWGWGGGGEGEEEEGTAAWSKNKEG